MIIFKKIRISILILNLINYEKKIFFLYFILVKNTLSDYLISIIVKILINFNNLLKF